MTATMSLPMKRLDFSYLGILFDTLSIQVVSIEIHVKFHNSGVPIFVLLIIITKRSGQA